MKIVDTDNFGGDYPDESFVASEIKTVLLAEVMCKAINDLMEQYSTRYYKVVDDNYVLQPGFEP